MRIKVKEAKALSFCEQGVKKAFPDWPAKAVKLVASWYEAEDAESDFSSVDTFAKYVKRDLPNMLDAAGASDSTYIKDLMAPKNPRLTQIKKTLATIFPGLKPRVADSADWYATLEYPKSSMTAAAYEAGLKKLQELMPEADAEDCGENLHDAYMFDVSLR